VHILPDTASDTRRLLIVAGITGQLTRILGRDRPVAGSTPLVDLGLTSALGLELLLGLEEEMSIYIDVSDLPGAAMRTVADLADYLVEHCVVQ
jgi:acyl carrier protein